VAREWLPRQTQYCDHTQILEWQTVTHYEHPVFSKWCCALGDIDADEYDDFAMGSGYDTTFIFLGGDPFNHDPAYFLSGGSTGLVSADFNSDGFEDLLTLTFTDQEVESCVASAEYPLQISGLRPGSNFVFLRQGDAMAQSVLTIL
jgi:hypothetical protein